MTLLQEALAATGRMGGLCSIATVRNRMTPEGVAEFDEALASGVQAAALSRALAKRNVVLSGQTINRHRRQECSCVADG